VPFRSFFGLESGAPPPPHPALAPLMAEAAACRAWYTIRRSDQLVAGKALLEATPAEQVTIVQAAFEHLAQLQKRGMHNYAQMAILGKLISDILRRDLPFSEGDVVAILGHARGLVHAHGVLHMGAVVKTAEGFARRFGLSDGLRRALEELRRAFGPAPTRQEERKLRARLEALLGEGQAGLELGTGEPWARAAMATLSAMPEDERTAWRRLLAHAQSSGGATPSRKWLTQAEPLLAAVGAERLREQVIEWLAHVTPRKEAATPPRTMEEIAAASRQVAEALLGDLDDRARAALRALTQMAVRPPTQPDATWSARFNELLSAAGGPSLLARVSEQMRGLSASGPLLPERDADALRGLVWISSRLPEDRRLAVAIGDLAQRCLKKVPNYGAYSSKVGNACIWTLGAMAGMEPVAQLARLKQRVKYPVSLRVIEKALAEAAGRASISPEDLEEMAVPAYGLTEPGVGRTAVADYAATVTVSGVDEVELVWTGPSGRSQKTVPQEVQRTHADELKRLKRGVKDIATMLPAQRDRIERLFFAGDRHWPLAQWRTRYLDHALLSVVSRRLIWHFQENGRSLLGISDEGQLVGVDGAPLSVMDGGEVRLWHPLGFPAETVLSWRDWLREHEVRQPFKQAHREIYIPTDAELQTSTYSNRFAAHIIRQHQFAALCRERGWRYHLQGGWDSHNVPTLSLPRFGLAAEFWVEPLVYNDDEQSAAGIYMQLATDQVRFTNADGTPRLLSEVPALVFSEVMRDVDLFVGVTSIGADPTWGDRGDERARTYWQSYAFGELNATAATRRDVLAALLPKLKIASRCALEGRFLRVQGKLRSYKIHLGSANILMEPNDRYLCIVPDRRMSASPSRGLVLPFEGDGTLSIIISKAILLAGDDRITDETIVRQIRGN
jgi:uncharacterized protein DUF4132